jgi:hypothetical protein
MFSYHAHLESQRRRDRPSFLPATRQASQASCRFGTQAPSFRSRPPYSGARETAGAANWRCKNHLAPQASWGKEQFQE